MTSVTQAISIDAPIDPDAQATVTDFLDYTEHLPADIIRSMTLIGKLDDSYQSYTSNIHELTQTYGNLPNLNPNVRPDPTQLRKDISHALDHALGVREASYAEADRMHDVVNNHYNHLKLVLSKLKAAPLPPSRDHSPVPQAQSPQTTRVRPGRKEDSGTTPPPRITLRLDSARAAHTARVSGANGRHRPRARKITVPGEVLPPPNPDSPPPFSESDWEDEPPSPLPMPTSRVGAPLRSRSDKPGRVKVPKPPKPPKAKTPKTPRPPRPPRPPGTMGTNVHSAVAGISTSNALSLLTPPPPDTKPGSEHAPWMRLTEWEMAKLRKRMKKNAIWTPSETMIRRELSDAGRGPENYRKALSKAEETGEEFTDCDNIATTAPGKQLVPGEISADSLGLSEKLSNKGMKLNEAKKLKKELLAREAAVLARGEADAAARANGDFELGSHVPISQSSDANGSTGTPGGKEIGKENPAAAKIKRKRDVTPAVEGTQLHIEGRVPSPKPSPKKRKVLQLTASTNSTTANITTTMVPLAGPAPSPTKAPTPTPQPTSPVMARKPPTTAARSRRPSTTVKASMPSPEPIRAHSHSASRPGSRRASAGPVPVPVPEPTNREHLRRQSATPAPTAASTAASRRSKRPAPGPVTNPQDGGAAVSVGKRKNAPRKRGTAAAANAAKKIAEGNVKDKEEEIKAEDDAAGEEIDPDEPRYCLCGDVSFGTMICCENTDVSLSTFVYQSSSGYDVQTTNSTFSVRRSGFTLNV